MANELARSLRCAIYTRKSSEEGLEQSFNSLDAQREACEAYILSQRHEGWQALATRYDDGGYSGGSMARPALQALIQDIEGGKIDSIVVYKVDRLTRALSDFAKMVDLFESKKSLVRLCDPTVQYHDFHGKTDVECPAIVCPV
ncbi:recombinase family protein [Undibacterium arcticum]